MACDVTICVNEAGEEGGQGSAEQRSTAYTEPSAPARPSSLFLSISPSSFVRSPAISQAHTSLILSIPCRYSTSTSSCPISKACDCVALRTLHLQ